MEKVYSQSCLLFVKMISPLTVLVQESAKEAADNCIRAHPGKQWRAYPVNAQKEVANRINTELAEASINPVGEDVVAWKMHILVRDGLAKGRNEKERTSKYYVRHDDSITNF
jgi:hypothetical protein